MVEISLICMTPLLENALGSLVAAIIVGAGKLLYDLDKRRIFVHRIYHRDDDDFDDLLELYSRTFPPNGSNYTAEEMAATIPWRGEPTRNAHVKCDDIFLIAKNSSGFLGFIWCCYYPDRQRAIVPYYAIDDEKLDAKTGGEKRAAKRLSDELARILIRHPSPCRQLVFEVQMPSANLPPEEVTERLARIRRFIIEGKKAGRPVRVLDFPYWRPKLTPEDEAAACEEELVLMFSNLGDAATTKSPTELSKAEVEKILEFVYLDCYGDILEKDHTDFSKFRGYLKSRLKKAIAALPATIRVLDSMPKTARKPSS